MDDLYIENFFHHQSSDAAAVLDKTEPAAVVSEEAINQTHFFLRILKEEIDKHLKDTPPFPLILEKLETSIFSENVEHTISLLDDLEEMLDLKYLPTV
jgi:hypothetical protein